MRQAITELMDDCCVEEIDICSEIDTSAVKADVLGRIRAEAKPVRRFRLRLVLVAAAVMTLLIGTAAAAGNGMFSRSVEDSGETTWQSYVPEGETYQTVSWPDASYALEFAPTKSQENTVYYRLGWLPEEWEGTALSAPVSTAQWTPDSHRIIQEFPLYNRPTDSVDTIPYLIEMFTIQTHEFDYVYYLNGEVTEVKRDTWNGWERLELTVNYTDAAMFRWSVPVNYLLLYDPDESILFKICGMMDLETYERMAEHLEIKISDEPAEYTVPTADQHIGSPSIILDLGRG